MDPETIKQHYDKLASWYEHQLQGSAYGLRQLELAIKYCDQRGLALDVGCGSTGRFMQCLFQEGFQAEGIDISSEMIALAEKRRPDAVYYNEDICEWQTEKSYSLISAWDSTFHLPYAQQEPILTKLCSALQAGGVILFTCGSTEGEICGEMNGLTFGYSSLGVNKFLEILLNSDCRVLHVEHDQWPEKHVCIIAIKS